MTRAAIDPAGEPYHPYHDVQAMVDGKAALALAELVRDRWSRGACEDTPPIQPLGDPWPDGIAPDLTDIDVGIARTYPATDDEAEIRECEALFFDSIDRAERTIYIENQYLTATRFAQRLAERMLEKAALEAVIVAPKMPHYLARSPNHACRPRAVHARDRDRRTERACRPAVSAGE